MSQQIKLSSDTKKEIEVYAALTGLQQKEVVAAAWDEYKRTHAEEFRRGLAWAASVFDDPGAAGVAASGMSADEIAEIDAAFNGSASHPAGEKVATAGRR